MKDLEGASTRAVGQNTLLYPRFGTKASRTSGARDNAPFPVRDQDYMDEIEMGQLNLPHVLKEFGGPLDVRSSRECPTDAAHVPDPTDLRVMITNEVSHDAT